ncbi:MAG: ABC transporter ATP-binding protein [Elusimicrobiota bacterium]
MSKTDLVKRAAMYLGPHGNLFFLATAILLIETALGIAASSLARPLFDEAILKGDVRHLFSILSKQGLLYLIATALGFARSTLYTVIGARVVRAITFELYGNLQRQSLRFFINTKLSEIHQRLYSDAQTLEGAFSHTLGGTMVSSVKILAVGTFMLYWNPTLTLAAIAALAIIVLLTIASSRISRRLLERHLTKASALNNQIFQTLSVSGRLLSSMYTGFQASQFRFEKLFDEFKAVGMKRQIYPSAFSQGVSLVTYILGLVVFLIGGHLLAARTATLGTIMAFASLTGYLVAPSIQVANALGFFNETLLRFKRVLEYLDIVPEIEGPINPKYPKCVQGRIVLNNVGFSYHPTVPLLKEVDLAFEPGAVTALMGPSGSGKTTLAYIIMRLLDPQHGSVTFDGISAKEWDTEFYRQQFAYVSQDPLLFNGTIRDNITLGKDYSEESLSYACHLASIEEKIKSLTSGYDTPVGEAGLTLSGGERQRIALARALLKNAPVYIFDEPTAFFDSKIESGFIEILNDLRERNSTIVLITHKESLARVADQTIDLRGALYSKGQESFRKSNVSVATKRFAASLQNTAF